MWKMSSNIESKNITKQSKRTEKLKAKEAAYQLFFGHNTYAEERRRGYVHKAGRRTAGFEALSDKDTLAKRLVKTKVCRNLEKFGKCTRKVCNFAHSPEELNDPKCVFGKGCHKRNICAFKHEDETSEAYRQRRGIKFPPHKLDTQVGMDEINEGKIEYSDLVRSVLEDEDEDVHLNVPPPTPIHSPEKETVLSVKMEMAAAAIELAIKQGKTNIRIEVI
jgi:hypothetical protein